MINSPLEKKDTKLSLLFILDDNNTFYTPEFGDSSTVQSDKDTKQQLENPQGKIPYEFKPKSQYQEKKARKRMK